MRREMNARLIALGAVGFLSGVGAFWVISHAALRQPEIPSAPVALLVGWSFIGSGLLSWRARPDNRLGPVMVLTGFAWFACALIDGNSSVLDTIGQAFQVLDLAGFLYLVLSFPSGRLPTALDRALMVVTFGLVTVVQLAWLLVFEPPATCDLCSPNLLEVARNDGLANALVQFQRMAGLAVIVVVTGLLAVRLVRASRPQRHAIIPVLLAGIAAIMALAVLARAGRRRGARVVVTCRGDETPLAAHVAARLAQARAAAGAEEIRLGALSRAEVATQVAALAGGPVPARVIDELYARAEGNPLFTGQLVAAALSAGGELHGPAGLPARLAGLLMARAGAAPVTRGRCWPGWPSPAARWARTCCAS